MDRRIPRLIVLAMLAGAAIGPEARAGYRYRGRGNSGNQQAARQQQAAIRAQAAYQMEQARQQQIFLNGWAAEQMAARKRSQSGIARREAAIATIQARHAIQSPPKAAATPTPAPYVAPSDAAKPGE